MTFLDGFFYLLTAIAAWLIRLLGKRKHEGKPLGKDKRESR